MLVVLATHQVQEAAKSYRQPNNMGPGYPEPLHDIRTDWLR